MDKWKDRIKTALAFFLAAGFVCLPLSMAPQNALNKDCKPNLQYEKCNKPWVWLGRNTTTTDWLLVIAGAFQIALLFRQISISRSQTDIQQRQAETLPRIERAYVFAEVFLTRKIEALPSGVVRVEVVIPFTNHGKTPAIIRAVNTQFDTRSDPPHGISDTDIELPQSLIIPSGKDFPLNSETTRHSRTWATIDSAPTESLYCYGIIRYQDVFSDDHETGFCWEYRPFVDETRFVISDDAPLNFFT